MARRFHPRSSGTGSKKKKLQKRSYTTGTYNAVVINGTIGSYFVDCFFDVADGGVTGYHVQDLLVSNCKINSLFGACVNFHFSTSFNNSIVECEFFGGNAGIFLSDCGNTTIQNCTVENSGNYGILLNNADGVLVDSTIVTGEMGAGFFVTGGNGMDVQNSVFQGSLLAVGITSPPQNHLFRNNHILPTPGAWWVWVSTHYSGAPFIMDLTHNYWGTTDVDEISTGIYDGYDDDTRNIFIEFEPMTNSPVSTTETTLGGIKAMFR